VAAPATYKLIVPTLAAPTYTATFPLVLDVVAMMPTWFVAAFTVERVAPSLFVVE
jgi:hypothetical protein